MFEKNPVFYKNEGIKKYIYYHLVALPVIFILATRCGECFHTVHYWIFRKNFLQYYARDHIQPQPLTEGTEVVILWY